MTRFSLTFDSLANSLVMVAGEQILDDLTEVVITKAGKGYEVSVVRAGQQEGPVRLVASSSQEGKEAMQRANGRGADAPEGFVAVSKENKSERVREEIETFFGCDGAGG